MNRGRKEMKKVGINLTKMLRSRALVLASQGYSVIPIGGDRSGQEPKRPTVKWRAFQKRIAHGRELSRVFDNRAGAIGVVCGRVSRLLVIDFDDHLRYQRFCRHLPQYEGTYSVKTRRGYHLYFRTEETVPTHQFEGGDIKGERSYVVAPPSVIGGFEYKVIGQREVLGLEREDVSRILNYFHGQRSGRVMDEIDSEWLGSVVDVAALYRRLSVKIGRNNALYRAACTGWRNGMDRKEIKEKLLWLHVGAPAALGHKVERAEERYQEGKRTINSACSYGGRFEGTGEGIPNSVRERLLQGQRSGVVARFIDVLYVAGWTPESFFCLRDAIAVSKKYGLNRKSVFAALTSELCIYNGRHIVARRYVEYMDIGGLNVGRRGRPVQLVFQVPSVARLLSVLGVSLSPSDPLSADDLGSSSAYRRALHREYVKRVAPEESMAALARRLGLSTRSLQRYNADLGVQVAERVGRFRLTWETLKCLPRRERNVSRNQTPGYWLALGESARFPAWRHIGAALLRRGVGVVHVCARRTSSLSLDSSGAGGAVYESMSVESFVRLRLMRGGQTKGAGVLDRLRKVVQQAGQCLSSVRYQKLRLYYASVEEHIAEDKIAETISGYLYARDADGVEVRRPARRGVAYRMLKEFGEGNVFLALRESVGEMLLALSRHAVGAGDQESSVRLLAQSMA